MTIRTILVPSDGRETARAAMEAAFTVGRDLAAHVEVFHVRADPKDAVPLLGEGMSGPMIEEMLSYAEKEGGERSDSAHRMFDECCKHHSVEVVETPSASDAITAAWVEETGRDNEAVARRGRLADLIVLGRPTPDAEVSVSLVLDAALFETGRPVLVAPPEAPAAIGTTVAIAWNNTAEVARAVGGALPFMTRAEKVVILTAESERTAPAVADVLAPYLAWHGVDAAIHTIAATGRGIGEALLAAVGEVGADLLVLGAYSHSRVRRLILGGVTRHMLTEATIPLLMAR